MRYTLAYHPLVVREDIPRLDKTIQERIKSAIEHKLMTHPEIFDVPLHRSLTGHRKLRVGEYRVVYRVHGASIRILTIQPRSVVYVMAEKRSAA